MGFSRQEHWSGLPFPSPGDLPDPGIKPGSPNYRQILYYLNHQGIRGYKGCKQKGGLEGLAAQALFPLKFLEENHFLLAGNGVKTMKFNVKEASPSGRSRNNRLLLLNSLGCSEILPSSAVYGPESGWCSLLSMDLRCHSQSWGEQQDWEGK